MPLHEAHVAFLQGMVEAGAKPIHETTPDQLRADILALADMFGTGPDVARADDLTVPAADGHQIPVRVLVPEGTPAGVLVYYHGGGWVIGSLPEFEVLGRKLAHRLRYTVVLADYRLAPEHRYPTAVDDAHAVLEWTAANVAELAAPGAPVVVAGDSAGGNLAAVVARRARDGGGPAVAMQALVYPVTDADFERPSYTDDENQLLLNCDAMVWFWDHYLPDAARRREPDASPLHADDLSGLPPAVVLTAQYDVLRDEGEAYAEALAAAGVPVTHHRLPGQMHAFFTLLMLPGHEEAIDHIAEAIKVHVAPAPA